MKVTQNMGLKRFVCFAAVLVGTVALFLFSCNQGSLHVTYGELLHGLFVEYNETVATIYDLRFPRIIIIALLAGAALAVSLVAVLLASITTAVCGTVSFLGLIVPHMGRILVGNDHKYLIPFSALLGAFIMLAADTAGRLIAAPYEISAAIIMSVVGGPFFIFLLKRGDKNYGN